MFQEAADPNPLNEAGLRKRLALLRSASATIRANLAESNAPYVKQRREYLVLIQGMVKECEAELQRFANNAIQTP